MTAATAGGGHPEDTCLAEVAPAAEGVGATSVRQASGPYRLLPGASASVLVKYCRVAAEISSRER